jgi:FMN phosphatase YigB (HAD superfamily)
MDRTTFRFLLLTLVVLSLPSCWRKEAHSTVVESNRITDIYLHLTPEEYTKDTLVIFDICNTLAAPPTDLASDQWFSALFNRGMNNGYSVDEALGAALSPYCYAQHHRWMVPIEPDTVSMVKSLQKRGITVIALTARGLYLYYRTLEQLNKIDIDFTHTSPREAVAPYGVKNQSLYSHGIIFAGSLNKGDVLTHWLEQLQFHPQKIIFVDDKLKNIESVADAMKKANYPFVGIRYGHLDERVKNFDMHKTEQEYQALLENSIDREPINVFPFQTTG